MILIISKSSDSETDLVTCALNKRGASYLRLDTDKLLDAGGMALRISNEQCGGLFVCQGRPVQVREIRAVWYRRQAFSGSVKQIEERDRLFVLKEYRHFMSGIWHLLRDRFWINPLQATEAAEIKPNQLERAHAIGLRIPRTLMTNDPDDAVAFFDECEGRMIYKTFSQYFRPEKDGTAHGIYTTPLDKRDILSRREQIRLAPCLFQEYIPKKLELRITVIGRRIFTVEIESQNSFRGRDDWRKCGPGISYRAGELPRAVAEQIHRLMGSLNLVFGCIDIIVTPDGQYVFLEINPMGQSLWLESATHIPLLDHFVEMLMEGTADYAEPSAVFRGKDARCC